MIWRFLGDVWLFSALTMTLAWLVCWHLRNAGYVDVAGAGLLTLAALYAGAVGDGAGLPRSLVAMMGSLWGARLCLHLLRRVLHEDEDGRYRRLREHWDGDQRKFFLYFQAQALFVVIFSVPFFVAASQPAMHFNVWMALALLTWGVSLAGETIADRQLAVFRGNPANRGKTCRAGLWVYSRHPNYFFEWLHWFAYVFLSVGAERWWLSLLGPAAMLLLLYRVTGIPWTEAQALRSRGEDYRRYKNEVSPFVPLPPKRHPRD